MTIRLHPTCIPAILFYLVTAFSGGAEQGYSPVSQIAIANPVQHLSIDEKEHRLYVVGESGIKAMGLTSHQVEVETNLIGATAFLPVSRFKFGYCLLPAEDKVGMFELKQLRLRTKPKSGKTPSFMVYNTMAFRFYTFNVGDNSMSIYEADDGDFMGSIPLPGKPRGGAIDSRTGFVYCTVAGNTNILVFNPMTKKVEKQFPIAAEHEPGALCVDADKHFLFAGCDNKVLAMLDLTSGKVLTSVALGSNPDRILYDPVLSLIFVTGDDGVTIVRGRDSKLTTTQHLQTPSKPTAIGVDPASHTLYIGCSKATPEATGKGVTESSILVFGIGSSPNTK